MPALARSMRFVSWGTALANGAAPYAESSLALLRLFIGDDFGGFPRNGMACRTLGSRQEDGPEVTAHAKLTPCEAEQKQHRNLLPEGLGRGEVDLGRSAIRAILEADSSHLPALNPLLAA